MHYDKVFSRDVFFRRTIIVRFESNAAARLRRVASS